MSAAASPIAFSIEARSAKIAATVVVGLGALVQLRFGEMSDVSWLTDCDVRWIAGAAPYRDFVETNPPASLLLYWPAVALARGLRLSPDAMVTAFGFLLCAAMMALAAAILQRGARRGASILLAGLVALFWLPGQTFCERDHLAAALGVPLLALAVARAERAQVPLGMAIAAGLAAAVMAAIKPPYALVGLFLIIFVGAQAGWRAAARAPEYYAAAVAGALYAALVAPLFPDFVRAVLPVITDVYVPLREPLRDLLTSPALLLAAMILIGAELARGDRPRSSGYVAGALATLAAAAAFVIQGKGWVYQAVPALMFATLAAGFALEAATLSQLTALAAGVVAASATVFVAPSYFAMIGTGFAVSFAVSWALEANPPLRTRRLAPLAIAAAIGAACGLCVVERPTTPSLEAKLAEFGPGLKIAAVSEDFGLAFPLVRRLGDIWTMRSSGLIVTAAVRRRLSERVGDAVLAARLWPYAEADMRAAIEDIQQNKPDAVLVGPTNTPLHAAFWADPRLQAALADYTRAAVETESDYPAELWLRKDSARIRRIDPGPPLRPAAQNIPESG